MEEKAMSMTILEPKACSEHTFLPEIVRCYDCHHNYLNYCMRRELKKEITKITNERQAYLERTIQ
jgi:hypothetical protein